MVQRGWINYERVRGGFPLITVYGSKSQDQLRKLSQTFSLTIIFGSKNQDQLRKDTLGFLLIPSFRSKRQDQLGAGSHEFPCTSVIGRSNSFLSKRQDQIRKHLHEFPPLSMVWVVEELPRFNHLRNAGVSPYTSVLFQGSESICKRSHEFG